IGIGGLYHFSFLEQSFYGGLEWTQYKNKSPFSWSNLKVLGGWKYTKENWMVTPLVEMGYGIGSFEESGGSYKISDKKGQVFSLEAGAEYHLGHLTPFLEGLRVQGSYMLLQNQSHQSFENTGSTSLKSQGFRLGFSYNF